MQQVPQLAPLPHTAARRLPTRRAGLHTRDTGSRMSRDTQTLATLTRARFDPQRTRAASQHIGLGLGLGLGFGIRLGLRLGLGVVYTYAYQASVSGRSSSATAGRAWATSPTSWSRPRRRLSAAPSRRGRMARPKPQSTLAGRCTCIIGASPVPTSARDPRARDTPRLRVQSPVHLALAHVSWAIPESQA